MRKGPSEYPSKSLWNWKAGSHTFWSVFIMAVWLSVIIMLSSFLIMVQVNIKLILVIMPLPVNVIVILRGTWISLAGSATSIIFVMTKSLSRQKWYCGSSCQGYLNYCYAIQRQLSLELSLIFTAVLRCWEHSFWLWQSLRHTVLCNHMLVTTCGQPCFGFAAAHLMW